MPETPPRAVQKLVHDPSALRDARLSRRMTLRTAATGAGISFGHLGELERGTRSCNFRPWLLNDLAKLYRVPVRQLMAKRDAA